jgi:hypothetical protein
MIHNNKIPRLDKRKFHNRYLRKKSNEISSRELKKDKSQLRAFGGVIKRSNNGNKVAVREKQEDQVVKDFCDEEMESMQAVRIDEYAALSKQNNSE